MREAKATIPIPEDFQEKERLANDPDAREASHHRSTEHRPVGHERDYSERLSAGFRMMGGDER